MVLGDLDLERLLEVSYLLIKMKAVLLGIDGYIGHYTDSPNL